MLLPSVNISVEQTQEDADIDIPEQSDYSTADAEKKRQIYEKVIVEAQTQIAKLLADRTQKPKTEATQTKTGVEKTREVDAHKVLYESGKFPADAKWVDVPLPTYKHRAWYDLE